VMVCPEYPTYVMDRFCIFFLLIEVSPFGATQERSE
jgi:hypothetical protein